MGYGKKLISLRGERTVQEVSNALGLSPTVYEAYERDERIIPPNVKKIIANYYELDTKDIFKD